MLRFLSLSQKPENRGTPTAEPEVAETTAMKTTSSRPMQSEGLRLPMLEKDQEEQRERRVIIIIFITLLLPGAPPRVPLSPIPHR